MLPPRVRARLRESVRTTAGQAQTNHILILQQLQKSWKCVSVLEPVDGGASVLRHVLGTCVAVRTRGMFDPGSATTGDCLAPAAFGLNGFGFIVMKLTAHHCVSTTALSHHESGLCGNTTAVVFLRDLDETLLAPVSRPRVLDNRVALTLRVHRVADGQNLRGIQHCQSVALCGAVVWSVFCGLWSVVCVVCGLLCGIRRSTGC